ncbi:hypothetical protein B0A55_12202 [Friedmanniomyces simplex]|uniref:Uncharacterized protein n=1 Tax=Friedmanniomyces simplex TaxID=329884 RepID=A0A4U0WKJ6_9PEZI|nr:hypothetical protein B0A55_12202 [Friedmanniomyces simplex]
MLIWRNISRLECHRADGMFRWLYCQLVALTKSKLTRPISVKAALHALPKGFDETYERMLNKIDEGDRQYALTLLFPSWTVTPTCIEASSSLESHAITAFKPLP